MHGISLMFNNCKLRSHEYLQVYRTTFEREAMCPYYTFTQNLFMTHTYLTFAVSLINTTAGMQPWIRVRVEFFLSSHFSPRPYRKGLGTKLGGTVSSDRPFIRRSRRGA